MMMDRIMELAGELGRAIKEDARLKRMNAATEAYQSDADLQYKMAEYNVQTLALTEEYKKEEKDMEVIHAIEQRINTLYDEISKLPVMVEYNAAQEEVNAFMNHVNEEITFQITGERPSESNCTHDCSTCKGCH
ncbi:MAG: YlbF family regulator [Clostridia bacterium]|nr:YlbF family regulator [Clostridia bacterium]